MAKTLKLNWGTVNLDLVTDSALSVMSWTPQVAMPRMNGEPGPVIESLTVKVSGATHDALSTNLQSLHQMQAWAKSYIEDHAGTTPVWLHAKLTNETGERRALVRAIDAQFISPWYGPMADNNPATMLALAIERDPYWEGIAASNAGVGTAGTAAAVEFDYTASGGSDIVGDVPARIGDFIVRGTPEGMPLGRLWAGVRSDQKHGTPSAFISVWECELGKLGTDAAKTTDTTASPGGTANTKVTITPGTTGWANRLTMAISNVSTNEEAQYGRHLWLLRYKVTAGTWEMQMREGYNTMADADLVQGPALQGTSQSWDYLELGIGNLPFIDPWTTGASQRGEEARAAIHVFARRTAGAGNLDLDCLCPIPIDEGFFKVGAFNSAGSPAEIQRYHSPRSVNVIGSAAGGTYVAPAFMENNFGLPPGDGMMVMVYARHATANINDVLEVTDLTYFPRWASLRGGE